MPRHPSQPMPLKYWSAAGLVVTYWCNARCASCYVNCSPEDSGWMDLGDALTWWESLQSASPHGCRIHLTGGEPFGDWPRLAEIARRAHDQNLGPLEMVETNAFWATDDALCRDRLKVLDDAGMERIKISADPYHQQYVPIERPRRLARVAAEVLGGERADGTALMAGPSSSYPTTRVDNRGSRCPIWPIRPAESRCSGPSTCMSTRRGWSCPAYVRGSFWGRSLPAVGLWRSSGRIFTSSTCVGPCWLRWSRPVRWACWIGAGKSVIGPGTPTRASASCAGTCVLHWCELGGSRMNWARQRGTGWAGRLQTGRQSRVGRQ